jgi:hypothetical protein
MSVKPAPKKGQKSNGMTCDNPDCMTEIEPGNEVLSVGGAVFCSDDCLAACDGEFLDTTNEDDDDDDE